LGQGADGLRFFVDLDTTDGTLQSKVRNAQLNQYNYIVVIGEKEVNENTIDVRKREGGERIGKQTIETFLKRLVDETTSFG